LYAIERDLAEVSPEERFADRQKRSKPILDAYYAWLKQQRSRTLPKSILGLSQLESITGLGGL
jgi:hypothetical protein